MSSDPEARRFACRLHGEEVMDVRDAVRSIQLRAVIQREDDSRRAASRARRGRCWALNCLNLAHKENSDGLCLPHHRIHERGEDVTLASSRRAPRRRTTKVTATGGIPKTPNRATASKPPHRDVK